MKTQPRRRRGEGSIYQRKDGMWIAQVYLPATGKPYQRARAKQSDAIAELKKMQRDADKGIDLSAKTTTVSTWMTQWLDDIASRRVKPNVLANYRSINRRHIEPHIGKRRLSSIDAAAIRKLLRTVETNVSSRTAQITYNVLNPAFADAMKHGLLEWNPVARVDRPGALSARRDPLTSAQAKALLRHLLTQGDPSELARWSTRLFTGFRQAQCLGLTWERVDFDNMVLDMAYQVQRLPLKKGVSHPRAQDAYPRADFDVRRDLDFTPLWKGWCLVDPKTESSRKIVPMVPPLAAALQAWRDASDDTTGLVWSRDGGKPIASRDDLADWKALCVAAGIAPTIKDAPVQHVGRNTVATLLLEAGVEESVRMAILGHSTVAAHRRYAYANTDITRAALEQMATLLQLSDASTD